MWNYNEKDYQDSKITIPSGKHRIRIASITPKISKASGNKMYEIIFDVSNYSFHIYYYLVFTEDNPQMVNAKLGQIRDSFSVLPNVDPDVAPSDWIGKTGAAMVKIVDDSPKVSYFIEKSKQDDLPPWIEPKRSESSSSAAQGFPVNTQAPTGNADFSAADNVELPFDL